MKSLLIVESPAKAKTLKKYLGEDFEVKASIGHVIDLPKNKLAVAVDKGFTPSYEIMKGKKKVLDEIAKISAKVTNIYLAPDPDREGEAIAKHISDYINESLKGKKKHIYRILVNEITEKGIRKALEAPSDINMNKFESQQARRILDRLVGYQISPILWKKVTKGLSAGRVQSVAVRLIVEREEEIQNFKKEEFWVINAEFKINKKILKTKLFKINEKNVDIKNIKEAEKILKDIKDGKIAISSIETKERKRNPLPPFITSKLQQEASRKLKFTPKKTMAVAQMLYEGIELGEEAVGLITYMRTDSVRVSDDAKKEVRDFILKEYGEKFLPKKANEFKFKNRTQDAHEAIRPTITKYKPETIKKYLTPDQYKLYSLIWNRFVASQMLPSIYDSTTVDISIDSEKKYLFRATGSVLKFEGYEKVYIEHRDDEKENEMPNISKNDKINLENIDKEQKFTQPPARYNVATIIKELEEQGIGRPSTYASIISTIQDRAYVEKIEGGNFKPTELGIIVNELLIGAFPEIMDIKFTAEMEDKLDQIEEGNLVWNKVLSDFYKSFKKALDSAEEHMPDIKRSEGATDLKCPSCGSKMVIKWGKMGQFIACSDYPNCTTTRNFTRDEDGKAKFVEEKESSELCPKCGKAMVIKTGRFGRFLACSDYPNCKGIKSISIGIKCPVCNEGDMSERRTKKGKIFYSCSNYPKCKFATWSKPVAKKCTVCGFSVMEERKDSFVCSNKECKHVEKK